MISLLLNYIKLLCPSSLTLFEAVDAVPEESLLAAAAEAAGEAEVVVGAHGVGVARDA